MLDAYGRNGEMSLASELFQTMLVTDVVSWTGIILALASNGRPGEALRDVVPNGITLLAVLTACARSKLVDLDERNFVMGLPFETDASVLGAFLGACKIHENGELGHKVGKELMELQPYSGQYVALSTLHVLDRNWSEAEQMRKAMVEA